MVEANPEIPEIDPHEVMNVKDSVKTLTDAEVDLRTKPSSIVDTIEMELKKMTCPICSFIALDPIQELNCSQFFCRACARSNLTKGAQCPIPECGETF